LNNPKNSGKSYPSSDPAQVNGIQHLPEGIDFVTFSNKVKIAYIFAICNKPHPFIKGTFISFCNFLFILLLPFLTSCQNNKNRDLASPAEYNLNKPTVIKLPGYLNEISGLAYNTTDKSVFAISDDKGWLYKIYLSGDKAIQKWKFSKKADFEDIVVVDSTFYVLQSNGIIFSLHFFSPDSITVKEYKLPLPGKNEFETLYRDKEQNRLIMLCKDCEADDKNSLSSWAFDLSSLTFSPAPAYIVDVRKIEDLMQEKKIKFKPSAAAIHPLTGQLFIISSVNKVLVVAGKNGIPEKVYTINSGLYKQPEGLTFTPEGHLIISNESANAGAADILIFKYNKGQ
jgi:uncharacterized protein YjiK